MKITFLKTSCLILLVVVAFVYLANPIYAKASTADMDYIETDMSTSEVVQLFAVPAAFIPAAIMIIGFIVMTYCVLRNVEVPLSFSSQTSFTDKLSQLGHYVIDNATDDIKNLLYSVYSYCDDNGITSVLGLSKFLVLQAGKFFGAITNWIGGSLLINPTDIGSGLIESFSGLDFINSFNGYSYVSSFESVFDSYSGYSYATSFGIFTGGSVGVFDFIDSFYGVSSSNVLVLTPRGLGIYRFDGSNLTLDSNAGMIVYRFYYSNSGYSSAPNRSSYSSASWQNNFSFWDFPVGGSFLVDKNLFTSLLLSLGFSVFLADSYKSTYLENEYKPFIINDVLNPAVDNVYVPTDVWNIDIVGTWEQIAHDVSATYDQTERIAAFVGDIPLTLTSAQSYAPTINDAGNYVFPEFGSVWKYPQYFFDILSGWGMFVGNCLRAVTVDEGGLSWIFYGGFVLLICGGIIGKILMG